MSKIKLHADTTPPGVYAAMDHIFTDKDAGTLINSIMRDYTPLSETQKAPGISFFSGIRAVAFAFRHPVHSFNLARFAWSGGYKSPSFQEKLLENSNLWQVFDSNADKLGQIGRIVTGFLRSSSSQAKEQAPASTTDEPLLSQAVRDKLLQHPKLWSLVQKHGNKLPEVGQILQNIGIGDGIFGKNAILDNDALSVISATLTNQESLDALKKMLVKAMLPPQDIVITTTDYQAIIQDDKIKVELAKFDINKPISQADLLSIKAAVTPPDLEAVEAIIAGASLSSKIKIPAEICDLLSKNTDAVAALKKLGINALTPATELSYKDLDAIKYAMEGNALRTLGYMISGASASKVNGLLSDVCNLWSKDQGLQKYLSTRGEDITSYIQKLAQNDPIKGYLDIYKVSPEMLAQIPAILKQPEIAKIVMESFAKKDQFFITVEKFLDQVKDSEAFKVFAQKNPQALIDASIGFLNSTEDWKVYTDSLGLNSGVLDAIGPLLHDPKIAYDVIKAYNQKDYVTLTETLINTMNIPGHPLTPSLQKLAQDGAFSKLITDIVAGSDVMQASLVSYGVKHEQIPQIAKIFEILLATPLDLKIVFEQFKDKKHMELSVKLLELTKTNTALKAYLDTNTELMTTIVQNAVVQNPLVAGYTKGATTALTAHMPQVIQSLVQIIGNPPDEIIKGIEQQDYMQIAKGVLGLLNKKDVGLTKAMKRLAEDKVFDALINGILEQHPEQKKQLTAFGITEKDIPQIAKIFEILLDKPQELAKIFKHFASGNYLELAKEVLKISKNDQRMKEYLTDNRELIAGIVNKAFSTNPEVKYRTSCADLGDISKKIVDAVVFAPDTIISIVDHYQKGAMHLVKDLASLGNIKEVVKDVAKIGIALAAKNEGAVGKIARVAGWTASWFCANEKKAEKQVEADKKIVEIEFNKSTTITNQGALFDGVKIGGEKTAILDLNQTSWSGVTFVNAAFSSVSMKSARFSNCSFLGATFDKDVKFSGATIDATTLASLADSRTNDGKNINLDGIRIIGDISGLDLTHLSLKNANFDGVTSIKDVKFDVSKMSKTEDEIKEIVSRNTLSRTSSVDTMPNASITERQNTEPTLVENKSLPTRQNTEPTLVENKSQDQHAISKAQDIGAKLTEHIIQTDSTKKPLSPQGGAMSKTVDSVR